MRVQCRDENASRHNSPRGVPWSTRLRRTHYTKSHHDIERGEGDERVILHQRTQRRIQFAVVFAECVLVELVDQVL